MKSTYVSVIVNDNIRFILERATTGLSNILPMLDPDLLDESPIHTSVVFDKTFSVAKTTAEKLAMGEMGGSGEWVRDWIWSIGRRHCAK